MRHSLVIVLVGVITAAGLSSAVADGSISEQQKICMDTNPKAVNYDTNFCKGFRNGYLAAQNAVVWPVLLNGKQPGSVVMNAPYGRNDNWPGTSIVPGGEHRFLDGDFHSFIFPELDAHPNLGLGPRNPDRSVFANPDATMDMEILQ